MMAIVLDFSTTKPDPAAMKAAGVVGCMCYLSSYNPSGPYDPKDLTQLEMLALGSVGLEIGAVWETTANRTSAGYDAGVRDAKAANAQADVVGLSADTVIYYATDGNFFTPQIMQYYLGVEAAGGRQWGAYGNAALIDWAVAQGGHGWHVSTWGSTSNAHLRQEANAHPQFAGTDVNTILKPDWAHVTGENDVAVEAKVDYIIQMLENGPDNVKGHGPTYAAEYTLTTVQQLIADLPHIIATEVAKIPAAQGTVQIDASALTAVVKAAVKAVFAASANA